MLRPIWLATFGLIAALAAAAPAVAQQIDCHLSDPYFVVTRERTEAVGTDILMRTLPRDAPAPICSFTPAADDFQLLDPDDGLYYIGMAQRYLVLQRSTGPDGSAVIYDIATGRAVVDVPADDSILVAGSYIYYWLRDYDQEPTAANCPGLAESTGMGLGSVIATEMMFDASTGKVTRTGDQHCSQTQ